MREEAFKSRLIKQAGIEEAHSVLDLGCGTATLTIMLKRDNPGAEVVGLDGDPRILDVARKKINQSGLGIQLDEAMSFAMPYVDESFDRVLSSLVFHHLSAEDQVRTLEDGRGKGEGGCWKVENRSFESLPSGQRYMGRYRSLSTYSLASDAAHNR